MKTTYHHLIIPTAPQALKLAIAADLHNGAFDDVIQAICREAPDMILIPGDLMDDIQLDDKASGGYEFLRRCVAVAPTYYSVGNHELACYHRGNHFKKPIPKPLKATSVEQIKATGAIFLDNSSVTTENGITVCGLSSGLNGEDNFPDAETLRACAEAKGFRILLCHHPEYFDPYIKSTDIELTVSGHAHGGQWRIFGQGIYAPGQGLFPRYTSGVHQNRFIISRGLGNHTHIPRFFNPRELIFVQVSPA